MTRTVKLQSVFIAAWVALMCAGFAALLRYEITPGRAATPDNAWPAAAVLQRDPGKPTLIMAAHPECPCTKASMAELEELAARNPGRFTGYVLFEPAGPITPEVCRQSALWKRASAIAGVTPLVDESRLATRLFGARTSGQVLLFDAAGRLQFSGGITAARDHVGPNDGAIAIASFLTTGKAAASFTPVFGCALETPGQEP